MVRPSLRSAAAVVAAAASASLAGCSYLHNRANDALDVFTCDGSVGPGLYAEVRATDLLAVGLGGHDVEYAGQHGRFVVRGRRSSTAIGPLIWGFVDDDEPVPVFAGDPSRMGPLVEPPPSQLLFLPADQTGSDFAPWTRGLHAADVDVTVTLGWVGGRLGFSPGELLDFVLGIFGLDLAGDDALPARAPAWGEVEPRPRRRR